MKRISSLLFLIILVLCSLSLNSCATPPPNDANNLCNIFRQYPKWYWETSQVRHKWNVPISVQMAIIYQESSFNANAKPPRQKLLWVIPWKRPTTAYGYSQALKGTWDHYEQSTGQSGSRDDFGDAADFIGWYANLANKKAGIPKTNAYELYLAYHEGIGNYLAGTYKKKPWLVNVAKRVQQRANTYKSQLLVCEAELPDQPWYWKWLN